jgi:hypothetical protein
VAHAYNPRYAEGGDQEELWFEARLTLSQKYLIQPKSAGGVAQGVGMEFKPYYCKKDKRNQGGKMCIDRNLETVWENM